MRMQLTDLQMTSLFGLVVTPDTKGLRRFQRLTGLEHGTGLWNNPSLFGNVDWRCYNRSSFEDRSYCYRRCLKFF